MYARDDQNLLAEAYDTVLNEVAPLVAVAARAAGSGAAQAAIPAAVDALVGDEEAPIETRGEVNDTVTDEDYEVYKDYLNIDYSTDIQAGHTLEELIAGHIEQLQQILAELDQKSGYKQ